MLRVKISIWPPTPVKIVKEIAFRLLFRRSRSFFGRCRSLFGRSRPKSERDLPKSKRLIENGLLRTFQKANGTFQKANGTFQKANRTFQKANRTFQKANRTFQKANGKQFLSRFQGGGGAKSNFPLNSLLRGSNLSFQIGLYLKCRVSLNRHLIL